MTTAISILCDNNISRSGFIGEHGFSALLERKEGNYLFDTGPGLSLPLNLKALQKDLTGLHKVFLSHGHYDHTGGLKWVVEQGETMEVIAHPAVFSEHMVVDPGKPEAAPRYVGCPFSREALEDLGANLVFLDRTREAAPGLWFLAGFERDPQFLPEDARLVSRQNGKLVRDHLLDDASLLLETESGPVLILGCAHAGILNILDHLKRDLHIDRLRGILGGTHLMFYGEGALAQVIRKIEDFNVDLIAVSHCTGMNAAIRLANHFGDRFRPASAGTVIGF